MSGKYSWYVAGWVAMLSVAIDFSMANNSEAAVGVRMLFAALFVVHGVVALGMFSRSRSRRDFRSGDADAR